MKTFMLREEARESLCVNVAGLPPGTPEALLPLGEAVGRDRNPDEVLARADVGSWGQRASRSSQNIIESTDVLV